MPKVYSPSQCAAWMRSPASHYLHYKEGWMSKMVNKGGLARILGTSFAAGVSAFWNGQQDGPEIAQQTCLDELKKLEDNGADYWNDVLDLRDNLHHKAASAVAHYQKDTKIPDSWVILETEAGLGPEYGWARPDLIVSPSPGIAAPLDYKLKLSWSKWTWDGKKTDTAVSGRGVDEIALAWQMMHYAWAISEKTHTEPSVFFVIFVFCEPSFRVHLNDFYIDSELFKLWKNSAEQVWELMGAMEGDAESVEALMSRLRTDGCLYPWHNFEWYDRWGRMEHTTAIQECKLHSHLIEREYIKKPRRTKWTSSSGLH